MSAKDLEVLASNIVVLNDHVSTRSRSLNESLPRGTPAADIFIHCRRNGAHIDHSSGLHERELTEMAERGATLHCRAAPMKPRTTMAKTASVSAERTSSSTGGHRGGPPPDRAEAL